MHTNSKVSIEAGVGRRRHRKHSAEFKAQVVAACSAPGVSAAAVAMANGVNANLARRWVVEAERRGDVVMAPRAASGAVANAFVPLQLPVQAPAPALDIRLELRRGTTTINVSWPCSAASQCAQWIREVLR